MIVEKDEEKKVAQAKSMRLAARKAGTDKMKSRKELEKAIRQLERRWKANDWVFI